MFDPPATTNNSPRRYRRPFADRLIKALHQYVFKVDWEGNLYCGMHLNWNYKERWLDISMPGYVKKVLQRFNHKVPTKPQHSPYNAQPKKYGTSAQDPLPEDTTDLLGEKGVTRIQQIVGAVLYYARAINDTALVSLSTISSEQTEATVATDDKANQLLAYLATHPNATVRYYTSDMVLNIHSDASYLGETCAPSRVAGMYFLGSVPKPNKPIVMNGAIYVYTGI